MRSTRLAPSRNSPHGRRPTSRARLLRQGDDSMLRHVISHLRRQDWMAVCIELVVVVVGVFIGVQASNWNEQRETDQKAAVFTQRLKSDLREEAWGYEMNIGYFDQVQTSARRAAD